jgi:uncharacterized protein (TIGR02266 family)
MLTPLMREERRSAHRARVPGVRVTYEGTSGERLEADVLDIGPGGVFIGVASPIAVGKRLSLEIRLAGEVTPWSALGRVVWIREKDASEGPPGMGVKLIDVDDSVVATITRLVASRERTEPGTGGTSAPSRERTVLGVGLSSEPAASPLPATPIISVAPTREKTVLGVGMAGAATAAPAAAPAKPPARELSVQEPSPEGWDLPEAEAREKPQPLAPEASIAMDLVVKKADPVKPAAAPDPPRPAADALPVLSGVPSRRPRRWPAVLVVLLLVAAGVYLLRDMIPWPPWARSLIG